MAETDKSFIRRVHHTVKFQMRSLLLERWLCSFPVSVRSRKTYITFYIMRDLLEAVTYTRNNNLKIKRERMIGGSTLVNT